MLHVPKGQGTNPQAQMFSDPNMAMDMMKKNLSMIIPQVGGFWKFSFFFSLSMFETDFTCHSADAHFCMGQLLLLWICCRSCFLLKFDTYLAVSLLLMHLSLLCLYYSQNTIPTDPEVQVNVTEWHRLEHRRC